MRETVIERGEYPRVDSTVQRTPAGTAYLTQPGVITLARPSLNERGVAPFLEGFPEDLGFASAVSDPDRLTPGAGLCKLAGQLCYMSFGSKRTPNAQAERYFANILSSGHGSVLEHASYSFLAYGISRSVTHELVRHRAGFAFSQVSQRYVSGQTLRFVERPEFQQSDDLHAAFVERIDHVAAAHAVLEGRLRELQSSGAEALSADGQTGRRKRIHQAARALLPNEVEAPIVVTGNVRAWRHFIEARANEHADVEIRMLAYSIYLCLHAMEPVLFGDYATTCLADGTSAVSTATPKV